MEPTWMTLALLHCVLDVHSAVWCQRALVPPTAILLLLAVFPGSSRMTSGQRLPSRDEEHFLYNLRHKELFYDTRRLPDGRQMKVFLPRNETERFYFLIKEGDTPLSFTITPCTSRHIKWRLLYQQYPTFDLRLPKYSDSTDELLQQGQIKTRHQGRRYVVLDTVLTGSRTKYTIGQTIPGLFTLEFTSSKSDASLQIYGTSFLDSQPYPELPANSEVTVIQNSDRSVTLSWKPSPSGRVHGQEVEYCVAVNRINNIRTHCAAVARHRGDRQVIPPHVGFGFPWEKKYKNVTIRSGPDNVTYTCVGQKTSLTVDGLWPGRRYYVDVYVISLQHNTSSTYAGRSVKIRVRRAKILKPGKIRTSVVSGQLSRHFRFHVGGSTSTDDVMLIVQPCGKPVLVDVSRNGRQLNSSALVNGGADIFFRIRRPRRGSYMVTVRAPYGKTTIKMSYWPDMYASLYPILPADSRLHVDDNQTSCRSLTIFWSVGVGLDDRRQGREQPQEHCIYVRKVNRGQRRRRVLPRARCLARRQPRTRYKVRCLELRAGRVSTHRERVDGLQPNSLYAITVYVTTRHSDSQWLSYDRLHVVTRASC